VLVGVDVSGRSQFSAVVGLRLSVGVRLARATGLGFARALGFRGARDFAFFPMHSPPRLVVAARTLAQMVGPRPSRSGGEAGMVVPSSCPCPWPSWLTRPASRLGWFGLM